LVPFHKLPELHKILKNELIHIEASYTAFTGKYFGELKDKNYRG